MILFLRIVILEWRPTASCMAGWCARHCGYCAQWHVISAGTIERLLKGLLKALDLFTQALVHHLVVLDVLLHLLILRGTKLEFLPEHADSIVQSVNLSALRIIVRATGSKLRQLGSTVCQLFLRMLQLLFQLFVFELEILIFWRVTAEAQPPRLFRSAEPSGLCNFVSLHPLI